ncbi:MAG: hypothetical protein SLRJCFUN_001544 [Candidatus Fervidibacter sp.]
MSNLTHPPTFCHDNGDATMAMSACNEWQLFKA